MQEELRAAAREATVNADVKAVIVYGGEKVFAAGADIKEMAEMSFAEMSADRAATCSRRSAASPRSRSRPSPRSPATPSAAAWRSRSARTAAIAGDNAKLGVPEILLGVIPGGGGTQRLARLIGPSKAKDLVFTGRFVGAEEALAIGLVDEMVAPDEVYNAARDVGLAVRRRPRAAPWPRRRPSIDQGLDTDLDTGLKIEAQQFAQLFATEDRTIGMESFVANGPGKAQFTGE